MGRKTSEDLFQLIHSLKRTEKRYFKLFSQRHTIGEQNKYLALFDAIARQKSYDEKALLRGHDLHPRLLPDQKNELYWLILRSLSVYASGRTLESRLRFQLGCIDILQSKGLFAQCGKILSQVQKTAKHLEKRTLYLECLERAKKLEFLAFNLKTSPKVLAGINSEIGRTLEQHRLDQEYHKLSEEMYIILAEETFIRSEKNKKRSKKIIAHPLMRKAPGGSFTAQMNYHRTHSLYCYSHADFKGFYKHCKAIAAMIEAAPGLRAESPKMYVVALQNLLIAQKNLRLYDELFETLHRLKDFESGSPDAMALVFAISHDIELTIYIDTGQFEKGALLAGGITKGLERHKGYVSLSHELLFYYNLAYCFIGCGRYKQALAWLNKVINHPDAPRALPNAFHMSNLLLLLTHYKMGSTDLVDYRIRSMARSFSKKNALYTLESLLLAFLSKAIVAPGREELSKLQLKLFRDLRRLHDNAEKRRAFSSFDFLGWAESQATGKSMSEIVQKRISALV